MRRSANLLIFRSIGSGLLDIAQEPDFSGPASFRDRHGVLRLGDVESIKTSLCFPLVRPPCMRLGSACPSNPRS